MDSASSPLGSVVALQRMAGNRAVANVLHRAPSALAVKTTKPAKGLRRGLTRTQELREIADQLIEQELGSRPARLGARRNGLKEIARRGGPRAETARRLGDALKRIEADLDRRAKDVASVADDLIEERLGARPKTPEARQSALVDLRSRGGDVGEKAGLLEKEIGEINSELAARQPGKAAKFATAAEKSAAKAEEAAAKEGEKVAVKEGEKVAVKEAEKVATKAERLYARVAAKVGIELLEALVPDPLDAISLMVDFAGSYAEAREAIRRRNLTSGFAIGWAAYLVIPRWEWAKWFAHTSVSRDVVTEVLGAAGVAENAFNEGLVRGFMYGEKHTTAQADQVRQKAFDAVLKATGHTPGRYDGDDRYTFGRDDVYSFAAAMRPATVAVLEEADRRRTARLERERLAKHAEEVNKRFGTGASWPR